MEELIFYCPDCGASFRADNIDRKKRIAYCRMCEAWKVIPKQHSNNSVDLQASLDEAVSLFKTGNFASARRCAETAISLSKRNAVAIYIVSFCINYSLLK